MSEISQLRYLDQLLANLGCRLTETAGRLVLEVGVGTDRTALIAGLARIILGQSVKVTGLRNSERRVGQCRYCGIDVLFIRGAKGGGWIPVDRRPLQGVTDDGTVTRIRESHFSTCPQRNRIAGERAQTAHHQAASKPHGGEDGGTGNEPRV